MLRSLPENLSFFNLNPSASRPSLAASGGTELELGSFPQVERACNRGGSLSAVGASSEVRNWAAGVAQAITSYTQDGGPGGPRANHAAAERRAVGHPALRQAALHIREVDMISLDELQSSSWEKAMWSPV